MIPESSKMQKEGEKNTCEEKGKAQHSVKVPHLYKESCKILRRYENKEGSLKTLVYSGKYREYRVIYGLLSKLIDNMAAVQSAIAVSNLLVEQPRFDPHLAQVLTTQLMVKGAVSGNCKPIIVFKEYEEKIRTAAVKSFMINEKTKPNDTLPRYVRVNTLLGEINRIHIQLEQDGYILENYDPNIESYDDFLQRVENLAHPNYLIDYHVPNLLVFPPKSAFWSSVLYKKNVVILQDKASCLPVFLSSVGERCNVIDACAAPGNKTSLIAAKINNKGKVIAVERHIERFKTMRKLIRNREATCVTVMNQDFLKLDPTDYCDVEYIFVDPSCSSSGTNVHEDKVSSQRIAGLATVQVMLLSFSLSFPSVKEVMYSTCSIYEEENEQVVDEVLRKYHQDFEIADLGAQLSGWKHFGNPRYEFGRKCLKTDVGIDKCTGFFVAKFVRKDKNKAKKEDSVGKKRKSLESSENAKEEEQVTGGVSTEISPEKKKKKHRAIEESNVTDENAEIEMQEVDDNMISGKEKKKYKKGKNEVSITEEHIETEVQEVEDDNRIDKKKKKKSKKENNETSVTDDNSEIEMQEVEDGNETDKKKKKKSKKEKNETSVTDDNSEIEMQEVEDDNETDKKKKKKCKKEESKIEENTEIEMQLIENNKEFEDSDLTEVKKRKKKKSKK